MRTRFLLPILLVTLSSTAAQAGLTWSVSLSTLDGSPLSVITPGTRVTMDISVIATGPNEVLGLTASISGYNANIYSLDASASTVPDALFYDVCFPSAGCFGGLPNGPIGVGPPPPYEEVLSGGIGRTVIFESIQLGAPTAGTGLVDPSPQFSIVFDVGPAPPGGIGDNSVFTIGVNPAYGDGYVGAGDSLVDNASVSITMMPEPTTALLLGLGLVGLSARRAR